MQRPSLLDLLVAVWHDTEALKTCYEIKSKERGTEARQGFIPEENGHHTWQLVRCF